MSRTQKILFLVCHCFLARAAGGHRGDLWRSKLSDSQMSLAFRRINFAAMIVHSDSLLGDPPYTLCGILRFTVWAILYLLQLNYDKREVAGADTDP
jgi:hypothetical protein